MRLAIESEQKGGSEAARQALKLAVKFIWLGWVDTLWLPNCGDAFTLPPPDC